MNCEEQDAQFMMQVQVGADLCVCPDHESEIMRAQDGPVAHQKSGNDGRIGN